MKSKRYGKSSEKTSAKQLSLFDEDDTCTQEETSPEKETLTYTRKKPQRKKPLDTTHLPREKRFIDLNSQECDCGQTLVKLGEESREELVFQPAKLYVIEHIRPKYTCRHCNTIKQAPPVLLPINKSKASASLLTTIILNKYKYHLPFYRQSKWFKQYGLSLSDQTIASWVMKAADQLSPLGEAFWGALSKVKALQADETPVKVLRPEKKGYMWLYHSYLPGQRFILFDFHLSRSSKAVNHRLENFKGLLQTDGYSGYNTQRQREGIISLGCWDHARRKFVDVVKAAGKSKGGKADMVLAKIGKLYALERELKGQSSADRQSLRQKKARPILDGLYQFLQKIHAPPKSLLGIAVTYCVNQWSDLTRYVDYGDAELSNCWIENQVRPFAVGKRNWLFVGNEASAKKAALLYSLIQSCELNGINPGDYLMTVLNQVHAMRRKTVNPSTLLPHTIDQSSLISFS